MNKILIISFLLIGTVVNAQTVLTIAGQTYTNSDDTWIGVNIPRTIPTTFIFKNNSITSVNRYGYMLQAGDEGASSFNNNLDREVITGNKFNWSGTDMTSITHGVFTGHNIDVVVKYNYLDHVPIGIIRKSSTNMSNTGGGVAYNIVRGSAEAAVAKGMSNVNIYNNTFYTDRTTSQTWRPLVHIYTNIDKGGYSVAHGTKIYNNIFYTKYQTFAITIDDTESLTGLQCDYNVYWCENGSPRFYVNGSIKTFAQWQALGFDSHSVVVNPRFKDLINFVPASRLDYGTNLGSEWANGLAVNAKWGTNDPATTPQNGKWQSGAIVFSETESASDPIPQYLSSLVKNDTPATLEMNYNIIDTNIVPAETAFSVRINLASREVTGVIISEGRVLLTLATPVVFGDFISVSYSKPVVNPLQSPSGGNAPSLNAQPVINMVRNITNNTKEKISIYPNPACKFVNISNLESSAELYILRIFDLTGKLRYETKFNPENISRVPVSLNPGAYIAQVLLGSESRYVQRLIIIE